MTEVEESGSRERLHGSSLFLPSHLTTGLSGGCVIWHRVAPLFTSSEQCSEEEAQHCVEIVQQSCLVAWDLGRASLSEP